MPASGTEAAYDPDSTAGPVPSPCIDVCRLDAQREFCIGCHRTRSEIASWRDLSEDDKRAVWRRLRALDPKRPPSP